MKKPQSGVGAFSRVLRCLATRARRAEVAHLKVGDNRCPAIANPGTLKLANRSRLQVASNWTRHLEPEAETQIAILAFRARSRFQKSSYEYGLQMIGIKDIETRQLEKRDLGDSLQFVLKRNPRWGDVIAELIVIGGA